ncbi:AbrB/MazE/SpoVT family DNA-binding domain-containing protein [Romboutsia sp.]|uniref:AbrB/MazE/SpoVT family DNA-binding domain-containing protein n=1 Tax=Romboutsia sp. TaxID=1965302 RepID=UPI002C83E8A3|nr:AbrB/MazE/SpoVT family DNA-binding domain-containing protein [Romboutsia sp.]HSQ90313.1 AbrB/MazE/SpoVT family DNA-binding domain-containing protein [Romboutsia sp.]
MEKRELNITFNKSGSGSMSSSIRLPISWIKELGIDADNRKVEVEFDGEKIIIAKAT